MSTFTDRVRAHVPHLAEPEVDWLQRLVADWQLLSDMSFADLVLWVRNHEGVWAAVAHARPSTGATVFYHDVVGSTSGGGGRPDLDRAFEDREICRTNSPDWQDDIPIRREAIPVVMKGHVLAVLARHTNLAAARTPSRLELTYLKCADDLAQMVVSGDFPLTVGATGSRRGLPRVGDGLLRLDREGLVGFASPNAVSALHRLGFLGELIGTSLMDVIRPLLNSTSVTVDESLPLVLAGRVPWRAEIEGRAASIAVRSIPILRDGERVGAVLLVRDVSEVRRRERELLTKEATIREVHHRVKNNLQTVAALLRLQARRLGPGPGQVALSEAMRRVSTIALVHEMLSESTSDVVDFDDVVSRSAGYAVELAGPTENVSVLREGSLGLLTAEDATPLALVLTELVTNAVEHGLGRKAGTVTIRGKRRGTQLDVEIEDNGRGMAAAPAMEPLGSGSVGADSVGVDSVDRTGLGIQIVKALVAGDLRGRIDWLPASSGGTLVRLSITCNPVGSASGDSGA